MELKDQEEQKQQLFNICVAEEHQREYLSQIQSMGQGWLLGLLTG